jgi:FkbM family methyltransferase
MKNNLDFQILLSSRKDLASDFFGGWEPEDILLVEQYASKNLKIKEKCVTNFLGVSTSLDFFSWYQPKTGCITSKLPFPDDGLHAEAIEYVALCKAFELAPKEPYFTAIELGASVGPWVAAAAKICERLKRTARMTAVEPTSSGIKMMEKHLKENGIGMPNVQINIVKGCVSDFDGEAFFPACQVDQDNGGQVSDADLSVDYRGLSILHEKTPVISLKSILKDYDRVDFLHIDIQGTETVLFQNKEILDEMDKKVALFFCASHSRKAEAAILDGMKGRDWILYRERPCKYVFDCNKPGIEGMTTRDGGMIFINRNLADSNSLRK